MAPESNMLESDQLSASEANITRLAEAYINAEKRKNRELPLEDILTNFNDWMILNAPSYSREDRQTASDIAEKYFKNLDRK